MNKCYVCEHKDSCLCFPIPYGCENFELNLEEHDAKVKADAIEECIKTLAKDEDTILTDKQYYTLEQLKGVE